MGDEVAAAKDAQLAHDADVILRLDVIAPCLQRFKLDADSYLGCDLERVAKIANLVNSRMRERHWKPIIFRLVGVDGEIRLLVRQVPLNKIEHHGFYWTALTKPPSI